jgi:hypothetical protein
MKATADGVLDRGHGMLSSMKLHDSIKLSEASWPDGPVELWIMGLLPMLPPARPTW